MKVTIKVEVGMKNANGESMGTAIETATITAEDRIDAVAVLQAYDLARHKLINRPQVEGTNLDWDYVKA